AASDFADLTEIRAGARDAAIEGVMLKRRDSPYVGGRKAGLWYKWKRDPLSADCVLMYAQRGSGKRSSFYSDFTFGC
ncbi:ATP-dependent DNA ligase, partial [Acinetobacter baumannii]